MKKLLVLAVLMGVSGCVAAPAPPPLEVKVPVMVKCIKVKPTRPEYRTPAVSPIASNFDKVAALVQDWVDSRKYELQLETALEACL